MEILFPEHKTVENRQREAQAQAESEVTKEIIVMEGDNDHYYEKASKDIAKLPSPKKKKPFNTN
jgi:hypothetical protein